MRRAPTATSSRSARRCQGCGARADKLLWSAAASSPTPLATARAQIASARPRARRCRRLQQRRSRGDPGEQAEDRAARSAPAPAQPRLAQPHSAAGAMRRYVRARVCTRAAARRSSWTVDVLRGGEHPARLGRGACRGEQLADARQRAPARFEGRSTSPLAAFATASPAGAEGTARRRSPPRDGAADERVDCVPARSR